MKNLFIILFILSFQSYSYSQFEVEAQLEVEAEKKHAIYADSKGAYGVFASGATGVWGIAQGKTGAGVYGHAGFGLHGVQGFSDGWAQNGVIGWARGDGGHGVVGVGTGQNAKGVVGRAYDGGEWAGYFWGGKGVMIRSRLSIENQDPQYPIHAGTLGQGSGNGAHLTDGGSWVSGSSHTFKEDFKKIDELQILDKIATLDIMQWQYKNSEEGKHIGPMAEDFYTAFGLGDDEKYIASTDADGVALAAIKALNTKLNEQEKMIDRLILENQSQKDIIVTLTKRFYAPKHQIDSHKSDK